MLATIKRLYTPWNLLILIILLVAFVLRTYRISELLGFWYDQGRDALVIWDLIHNGKMFLIGPMMGNTGIFRGPWYYYMLAPFYYIGEGNPVIPAVFLVFLSVVGLYVLYKIAVELDGIKLAVLSVTIASVSSYIIGASRWLSNPTPTLLTGVLFIYFMYRFLEKKKWALPLAVFTIGMGLNFGAATEVYLVPALLFILYIFRKKLTFDWKIISFSIGLFVFSFLPQILFEVRHGGVMSKAFYDFVINKNSFTYKFWEILPHRMLEFYNLFYSKFWVDGALTFLPFFIIFIFYLVINLKRYWVDDKFKILFIVFLSPFLGTLFFVSNLGGFYDYYFTAFYFIFILFFSFVLLKTNKIFVCLFLLILIFKNTSNYMENYSVDINKSDLISLKSQISAIEWIRKDSEGSQFNVDVYVPPVVPYAYEYLFLWRNLRQSENQTSLLYTLVEADLNHPARIEAWLKRQEKIGNIIYEQRFGGITVQRRERI